MASYWEWLLAGVAAAQARLLPLLAVVVVGAVPSAVDAGRDSAIILSGYESGVTVGSGGSDSRTIGITFAPDTPPLPHECERSAQRSRSRTWG